METGQPDEEATDPAPRERERGDRKPGETSRDRTVDEPPVAAYRRTLDEQVSGIRDTGDKAMSLLKIDVLVVVGVVAAWHLLGGSGTNLYVVAAVAGFGYSVWCCIRAYGAGSYDVGVAGTGVDESVEAEGGRDRDQSLADEYGDVVSRNESVARDRVDAFVEGLWAAFAGTALFAASLVRVVIPSVPSLVDVLAVVAIVLLAGAGYRESPVRPGDGDGD